MNISPIVNIVKCTFFACIVHFLHVLEGSTAYTNTAYYPPFLRGQKDNSLPRDLWVSNSLN